MTSPPLIASRGVPLETDALLNRRASASTVATAPRPKHVHYGSTTVIQLDTPSPYGTTPDPLYFPPSLLPLSGEQFDDVSRDKNGVVRWSTAVWELGCLAVPAAVSLVMTYVIGTLTISAVGKMLGVQPLAGASVGLFALNCLVYPLYGLAYAVDTLCSQEYGRDPESDLQGLIMQRGLIVNLVALVPCGGLILLREPILAFFYDATIVSMASEFLQYSFVYLLPQTMVIVIGKYLNNMRLPHLLTLSLSTAIITTPIALEYFVPRYGLAGAMLAMGAAACIELLVIALIVCFHPIPRDNFGAWRLREAVSHGAEFRNHVVLALSSAAFVALESCAFDVSVLLAGSVSDTDGATWSVVLNILLIFVSAPGGLVASVTALVGSAIGSHQVEDAKRYATAAFFMMVSLAIINDIILYLYYDPLLEFFTSDKDVIAAAGLIKTVVLALHVVDSGQFCFQGILSGLGRNDRGAVVLGICLWVIGLPISYFAPRNLMPKSTSNERLVGVIGGLLLGLAIELPVLVFMCYQWDWRTIAAAESEGTHVEEQTAARIASSSAVLKQAHNNTDTTRPMSNGHSTHHADLENGHSAAAGGSNHSGQHVEGTTAELMSSCSSTSVET